MRHDLVDRRARCRRARWALIVASRFFAVGALCPYALSGVGALSTQALVNPLYGMRGLTRLAQGMAPTDVLRTLIYPDAGRDHRQVHLIDAEGNLAVHTGVECIDWCGHVTGEGFSVAGNMLAGPQVIEDTAQFYDAGRELPFAERLIAAMQAGEAAGGDKRGKQAVALIVCTTEAYPALDLRVDDHPRSTRRDEPPLRARASSAFSPSSLVCQTARGPPASPTAPRSRKRSGASRPNAPGASDERAARGARSPHIVRNRSRRTLRGRPCKLCPRRRAYAVHRRRIRVRQKRYRTFDHGAHPPVGSGQRRDSLRRGRSCAPAGASDARASR